MVEIGFAMPLGSGIPAPVRWEFAEEIERLGYGSFWYPHYVARDIHGFDCLDILCAVAARTKRIKLGTGVLQVPLYHPIDLARRVATLDHISNGRYLFGIGIGWIPREFENLGIPFKERSGRTTEALDLMTRLWTEEEVTYEGKYYKVKDAVLLPKPLTRPYPKILIGGGYHTSQRGSPDAPRKPGFADLAIKRIGRFGDGWMPAGQIAGRSEILKEGMKKIQEAGRAAGREITEENFELTVVSYSDININEDWGRAERDAQEFYASRQRRGFYQVQGNPSFESLRESGGFGPPEKVAAKIGEWMASGRVVPLKRIVIMFASLNPLEQLRSFHEKVRPLFSEG